MPVYKYAGRTRKGTMKKGTIESVSRSQAIMTLREKGISPREVTETKATIFNKDLAIGTNSVKSEDFVIYCRQFATLVRAGISIVEATNILAAQTESKGLKKALFQVESDIKEGHSFSDSAEKHPKVFPPLFINMIRAGELTGNIDSTLDRIASYLEKQNNMKKKVQSTMAYPLVLSVVIIAVVIFLMVTIVPQLTSTFEGMGSELPAVTQLVVSMSDFIQELWWVGLIGLAIILVIFLFFYKNNNQFNYYTHIVLFKTPVFGKLLQKSAIARMTRTLASLFASSVPILQALAIVEKVVGNPVVGKVILEARDSLEQGRPLSEPLEKSWIFPPLVSSMTAIGEQTGQLDFMLSKIADFYEEDVDRTVDTLKSLIEPIMILLLAGVVGFVVIAIMVPMFSVYTQM
ncbi:type II secretion system F family protein [Oceanobacillus piezotolerans]|uniref:Type II secretion system F family protein n=1 Tax=Oceanobacillus piezotolerans TaxID=2448030 RepID=A0A498D9S8_9BACI|nr:type II secretion system F family protein [Oceanobacillus piezotolerans]RLL47864.1 type II secretion system F family protein [Oceanobacillus piezotolerans]